MHTYIHKKKGDDREYSTCGYGNTLYSEAWQCAYALSIVPWLKLNRQRQIEREREQSCRVGSIVKCACLVMHVIKAMLYTRTKGLI